MDPKIIARATAVILLAGVLLACALELAQRNRTPAPSTATAHDNKDPLADELSRCNALGAEAANDAACKVAWSQNRARFLARSAPYPDRSIELFPATPDMPQGVPKIHRDRLPSTPQSDGSRLGTNPEGR
jgi:conjugative transfer region protein TrbK